MVVLDVLTEHPFLVIQSLLAARVHLIFCMKQINKQLFIPRIRHAVLKGIVRLCVYPVISQILELS